MFSDMGSVLGNREGGIFSSLWYFINTVYISRKEFLVGLMWAFCFVFLLFFVLFLVGEQCSKKIMGSVLETSN